MLAREKSMSMQAVVLEGHGGPEFLKLRSVERPKITGAHDVLIRVMAAGVNPADWQARKQSFGPLNAIGLIMGLDGAGIVEAVGAEVSRFKVGDAVYYLDGGFGANPGSYAEFRIASEFYIARKPANLSFNQAAALPVVLVTSWEALYDRVRLKAGEFALIHGGAGGLGHIAIQLAKIRGARVAATISTKAKASIAESLGADRILFYRDEDIAAAARDWTGKDGVDVVFDTVGGPVFAQSLDLLTGYGRLVSAVASDWPTGPTRIASFKNLTLAFEVCAYPQMAGNHAARVLQTQILEEAGRWFEEGKLRVVLDRAYPLAEAGEAQRALEAGEITGRVVLELS
jgi:NADPH:quinone reductase